MSEAVDVKSESSNRAPARSARLVQFVLNRHPPHLLLQLNMSSEPIEITSVALWNQNLREATASGRSLVVDFHAT